MAARQSPAAADAAATAGQLAEALTEVARLEAVEAQQAGFIEQLQTRCREVELALAGAQVLAQRVPTLEKTLQDLRKELAAARRAETERAVEAGRLAGVAQPMRAQLRELVIAIKPVGKKLARSAGRRSNTPAGPG